MKKTRSLSSNLLRLVPALVFLSSLATTSGHADVRAYGKTYGEWGARWEQWALSGPNGQNAIQDMTGEFCAQNQPSSKIWFLAGSFMQAGVQRSCTIPPNRALFYPIIEQGWIDCPGTPDESVPDAEVRATVSQLSGGDPACWISSTVDGVPISSLQIPIVRTQTPIFHTDLPQNHILTGVCSPDLAPGLTGRQIAEGYWALVPPLAPGKHELKIKSAVANGASCAAPGSSILDVTYTLDVQGKSDD